MQPTVSRQPPLEKPSANTLVAGDSKIVVAWKVVEYLGLILFVVLVPRSMGPERYGEFAIVLSLLAILAMVGGLGGGPIFGRFVPQFEVDGHPEKTKILFTQWCLSRIPLIGLLAGVLVLVLPRLLPGASAEVLRASVAAYLMGAFSMAAIQLFYGLNKVARWMARDSANRLLLSIALLSFGGIYSLSSAVYALAGVELLLSAILLVWAWPYFTARREIWDFSNLVGYLRFGFAFFVSNLLLMGVWYGGELIVASLAKQTSEVAYYNLASAIAMAANAVFWQLSSMLIPSMASMRAVGDEQRKLLWLGKTLKYLTVAAVALLIVVQAFGAMGIKLLLGDPFDPVASNLWILICAMLPMNVMRIALSNAVVHDQPRQGVVVGAAALITFIVAALLLTPHYDAKGTSGAVVIACFAAAAVSYKLFALGPLLAAARYWRILMVATPAVLIQFIDALPTVAAGLLSICLFTGLLFAARIVSVAEIRSFLVAPR